jgi:dihydroxyacetone kinase
MKTILFFLIIIFSFTQCNKQEDNGKMQRKPIEQVLKDRQEMLLSIPGAQGFYQSKLESGADCIVIMVDKLTEENKDKCPKSLDGYAVLIEEVGQIKPLDKDGTHPSPKE